MPAEKMSFLRRRENPVQIKRVTKRNMEEFLPYLKNVAPYEKEAGNAIAFGAYLYGTPCGAVELRMGEGYIDLYGIRVETDSRNLGVGSRLLQKAKEFADEWDIRKIYAEFMLDDGTSDGIRQFLRKNSFLLAERGAPVTVIHPGDLVGTDRFRQLLDSGEVKNTVQIQTLPSAVRGNVLQNIKGRLAGDLSSGIVIDSKLCTYVIVTEVDGTLCLDGAYTGKDHVNDFVRMVCRMILDAAEKYPKHNDMYVTADSPVLINMLENMSEGVPLETHTACAMMWMAEGERNEEREKLINETAQAVTDGMEILVPKLMRLMDAMEELDVTCEMIAGELPYLIVDNRLFIRYVPVGEDFEQFVLSFTASIPSEKAGAELLEECRILNTENIYFTATPRDSHILLRYAVPEYSVPIASEQFLACLDRCMQELSIVAPA